MNRQEVAAKLLEIGIVPAVRTSSAEEARFAAHAVAKGGIPIVEITMTVPGAMEVISDLVQNAPEILVGAGTVLDLEVAQSCLPARVPFLPTPPLHLTI